MTVRTRLQVKQTETYFGLEVAVHDAMVAHESQRLQHLAREAADQTSRETMEVVGLDEFVEVDTQQLHRDTQVPTEVEVFCHFDNVMLLIRVLRTSSARPLRKFAFRKDTPISAGCLGS